jgi:hypothetical protein
MVVSAREIVQDTEPEPDMHEAVADCSQNDPAVLIMECVSLSDNYAIKVSPLD